MRTSYANPTIAHTHTLAYTLTCPRTHTHVRTYARTHARTHPKHTHLLPKSPTQDPSENVVASGEGTGPRHVAYLDELRPKCHTDNGLFVLEAILMPPLHHMY